MANLRQTILIRKDLDFPIGLLAAQCSHLHMERYRQIMREALDPINKFNDLITPDEKSWLLDPYIFIHGVPNTEVLSYFIDEAKKALIYVSTWRDTVYVNISDTQRKAFPNVMVGATLGPCDSDRIKAVIGDLPLL
jgi:hypothetical protein